MVILNLHRTLTRTLLTPLKGALMMNLSTFLPCGKAGCFPTPATYEWSVSSVGIDVEKHAEINTGGEPLTAHYNPFNR